MLTTTNNTPSERESNTPSQLIPPISPYFLKKYRKLKIIFNFFKLFFLCFRAFQDNLKKTLQNILDFSEINYTYLYRGVYKKQPQK